jgi:hypothetical protein
VHVNKRMGLLTAGLAVALVAGGGAALASEVGPVGSTGVITGCYTNAEVNGSHALVLQDAGTSCPKGTSAVTWDEQGAAGPAGPAGATGPQGPAGPAGATGAQGPPGAAGTNGTNGTDGTNGTNGTSVMTSQGAPTESCAAGDTDIELNNGGAGNGEVWTCNSLGTGWNDTGSSVAGTQGPAGASGTSGSSVVTSSGAPSGTCTPGDTDIELNNGGAGNGEVYTCSASAAWADTMQSIQGPQGPAGPAGATGQTAQTVNGVDPLTLTATGGLTDIPGLAETITVPANSVLLISTHGGVQTTSTDSYGFSAVEIGVLVNGSTTYAADGLDQEVDPENNAEDLAAYANWDFDSTLSLPAGQYTIAVAAAGEGEGFTATVSSYYGYLLDGSLTVTVLNA